MILVNNRLKFPIWFVDWVRWTWSGNLLGKLKYSQEDSLGLEFAFVFLLSFPCHKSLMGKRRREWKGNEEKNNNNPHRSMWRDLSLPTHPSSEPGSRDHKSHYTNQKSRTASTANHFQKYIPRALFSPNAAHHEWTVLRFTWPSDLGINEKWWKVQPFPFYDVVWNDRIGNQKPGESLS